MCTKNNEKYLGQILSSNGKNTANITAICNKGVGISKKIIEMLQNIPGGKFYFEIAVIFRNAYLISSIMSGSEVWYAVTMEEIEQLEAIDVKWMRNLFQCSWSVPDYILYLELSILPIYI